VATLTLRRPSLRNSLTDDDLKALLAHFETLNRNMAVQVVVLRAETTEQTQAVFSAGYNVGGFDNDPMAPLFLKNPRGFGTPAPSDGLCIEWQCVWRRDRSGVGL